MKKLTAKINASYSNYCYLNIGKAESLRVPTGNFKEIPSPGSICEVQFEKEGRLQFADKSISTYRVAKNFSVLSVKAAGEMIDDDETVVADTVSQPVETAVEPVQESDVPF